MKTLTILGALFGMVLAGCAENTLTGDGGEEAYDVELRFSDNHPATLQPIEMEVFVRDGGGDPVTIFSSIIVQHRLKGMATWFSVDVPVHGDHYATEHRFTSSGDHEFRVMGSRKANDELEVLHPVEGHMEIERAHMEMDGLRVSYEHFPGDIHEGEEATVRFWIQEMGSSGGHGGSGGMMGGLAATITCMEADGSREVHAAAEHEPGLYEALHTFGGAGDAVMTVEFMHGGMTRAASFNVPVGEQHPASTPTR